MSATATQALPRTQPQVRGAYHSQCLVYVCDEQLLTEAMPPWQLSQRHPRRTQPDTTVYTHPSISSHQQTAHVAFHG
jgi:hypothetical protein